MKERTTSASMLSDREHIAQASDTIMPSQERFMRMLQSRLFFVLLCGLISAGPARSYADADIVPVFTLSGSIREKPVPEDFPFGPVRVESFHSLITRMNKAASDRDVAAVVILLEGTRLGYGQLEELRDAMARLQKAGKPVYTHTDWTTTGGLTLLSGVSRFSMTPTGYLFATGLHAEQVYLRGLLDKLGVQPDFLTCGDYKSAGETFMRTGPSPQAEEMYNWLYDGLFDGILRQIADGRNVDRKQAQAWIDQGLYSAESAQKAGLIDAVEYRNDFIAYIKSQHGEEIEFDKKYGKKRPPTVDLNNPFSVMQLYMQLLTGPPKRRSTGDAVAIVYVEGAINSGSPTPSLFGPSEGAYSDPIRKALEKALEDKRVKAVVLRVDSPGGSAVASEAIMQATQRVAAKKPLVVSMGNVAASGGYYVSLASDTVYADPSTITGSIGVVGGKIVTTGMWNKIGVTFHGFGRGKRSSLLSTGQPWSDDERAEMQSWMDEVYEVFKQHVVDIRGDKLAKPIEELAGGRVFTGRQALEFGLVDHLGGLHQAIEHAARKAGLEKFDVRVIPRPKNFLELMMGDLSGQSDEDKQQLSLPGMESSLWKAALPLLQGVDPQRMSVIQQAFEQLELLKQERVIMAMPPLHLGF